LSSLLIFLFFFSFAKPPFSSYGHSYPRRGLKRALNGEMLLFAGSLTMIDKGKGMIATIQNRFIAVREALGITQRDFCKGIYVCQSYYAQIESGKRPVNDRIIALVCSQYGVSKKYLLTGKGEMFSENLPDIQLHQLLEIFSELEPPFKDYIVSQIKQLVDAVKKQKGQPTRKSRKRPLDT
jgi:transcriptional regulator with XRE-family HTH domain